MHNFKELFAALGLILAIVIIFFLIIYGAYNFDRGLRDYGYHFDNIDRDNRCPDQWKSYSEKYNYPRHFGCWIESIDRIEKY